MGLDAVSRGATGGEANRVSRFRSLDAIRGVAALAVVVSHATFLYDAECSVGESCRIPVLAYLAVDMFFLLSGFVLSHAYDRRFASGLTSGQFMRARFERLFPIFWIGLTFGAVIFLSYALLGYGGGFNTLAILSVNGAMLPSPIALHERVPFPLNPPAWSLFFEFWVAGLSFAFCSRILRGWKLVAIIGVSFVALVMVQNSWGTINLGWTWPDFLGGFPRVMFSFWMGVALCRASARVRLPTLPGWLILSAVVISFVPNLQGAELRIYEIVAISVIYPAAIMFSLSASERVPMIGKALGDVSYAIYITHFPILWLAVRIVHALNLELGLAVTMAYVLICIVVALAIQAFYDRWLKDAFHNLVDWSVHKANRLNTGAP